MRQGVGESEKGSGTGGVALSLTATNSTVADAGIGHVSNVGLADISWGKRGNYPFQSPQIINMLQSQ